MVHIQFSLVGALQVYLAIGVVVLLARLATALGQWVADESRKLATKNRVSFLRAAVTLHVCAAVLACMAVTLWPNMLWHVLRSRWSK